MYKRKNSRIIIAMILLFLCLSLSKIVWASETDAYIYPDANKDTEEAINQVGELIADNWEEDYDVDGSQYQLKRIVVFANKLVEDYGASEIISNPEYQEFVLQFDTKAATKAAYQQIQKETSYEGYFLDTVIASDDVLLEVEEGSYSWGTYTMGLGELKEESLANNINTAITVAVIDTGADRNNSLLKGRINEESKNIIENNNDLTDYEGHGSHVAGIVSQSTSGNIDIMVLKVFNANGKSSVSAVLNALEYATIKEADVINISLGIDGIIGNSSEETFNKVIDSAYTNKIPICASAGNDAEDMSEAYPACNLKTIAVSAIDEELNFADYSNYGALIDFCAPGSGIVSAKAGGTTTAMSGTSMASPHLAAACAMIKNIHKDYSVTQIYQVLQKYAVDLGTVGRDNYYGYGYVQLATYYIDEKIALDNSIQKVTVSGISDKTFTGTARKCSLVIKKGSNVLKEGVDYKLSYSNNIKPGTATIIINGIGNYNGRIIKTFKIKFNSPMLSKATSTAYNAIKVTWKSVSGADGYYIYRKTSNGWKRVGNITTGHTLAFTDTGLTLGTTYTYTVKAYTSLSTGMVYSTYHATGIKAKTILPVPTLKTAQSSSYQSIKLTWSKVSGANGYYIYQKTSSGLKKIATISTSSTVKYTVQKLTCGKNYTYTIKAYRKVNGKAIVSSYNKTGLSAKPLPATPTLRAVSKKKYGLTFSFKKVSGTNGYYIYRKVKGSSTWKKIASLSAYSTYIYFYDRTVKKNVTYLYTVSAYRKVGGVKIFGKYNTAGLSGKY